MRSHIIVSQARTINSRTIMLTAAPDADMRSMGYSENPLNQSTAWRDTREVDAGCHC